MSVPSTIKLTKEEWNEQLTNNTSEEYKNLASQFISEVEKTLACSYLAVGNTCPL